MHYMTHMPRCDVIQDHNTILASVCITRGLYSPEGVYRPLELCYEVIMKHRITLSMSLIAVLLPTTNEGMSTDHPHVCDLYN